MKTKELLKETEGKMKKALDAITREFAEVRTGRAHPALIENLHVDYYGTSTPLKQIAAISAPEPRLFVIQPWDVSAIRDIEKAISNSKLGVTPNSDGKLIRFNVPQLSKERREELVKIVKDMAEHGRISMRTIRRDANEKLKHLKDDGHLPEDDYFRGHDDIQKVTDKFIKDVEKILEEKNKELLAF